MKIKSRVITGVLLLAAVLVFSGAASAKEIGEVSFKKSSLPGGWVMTRNIIIGKSQLSKFEKKWGVKPIKGITNQVFIVNRRCRLQVNFVQLKNPDHAANVARQVNQQVGHVNKILLKENLVIEIITRPENVDLKKQTVRLLSPAKEL